MKKIIIQVVIDTLLVLVVFGAIIGIIILSAAAVYSAITKGSIFDRENPLIALVGILIGVWMAFIVIRQVNWEEVLKAIDSAGHKVADAICGE